VSRQASGTATYSRHLSGTPMSWRRRDLKSGCPIRPRGL
jgi:hypothetical protein